MSFQKLNDAFSLGMLARGVLVLTLVAGLPAGGAENRQYTTGQAAIGVVGQATFSANVPGPNPDQMGTVSGVAVAGNRLIVSDGALPFTTPSHNRILIFNNLAAAVLGSTADLVIGQTDFTKTDPGLSEKALNQPIGVSTTGCAWRWPTPATTASCCSETFPP